jgi:cyanophycinase-like exopeptidase
MNGEGPRLPRLLVLIGSGELAPPMARLQRDVVGRLGAAHATLTRRPLRAAVIDTTYGFQENADAISVELVDFCRRRLGLETALASMRRADGDVVVREQALSRIARADYVFSGPGSPSYALRHWREAGLADVLAHKLAAGGAVVFASAAALTLGALTLPVYEIYKAGADAHWLPGLDLLAALGIRAAVVPHFDNTDGGGHDTRFCFVGERRLRMLEEQLAADVSILGIDEHTALVIDLDAETGHVAGRGGVTVRRDGQVSFHPADATFPLAELRTAPTAAATGADNQRAAATGPPIDDLAMLVRDLLSTDEPSLFRARIVVLGERLQRAEADRSRLVEPLVELLLDLRREARAGGNYASADAIRQRLAALGVRIADEPGGSSAFELS